MKRAFLLSLIVISQLLLIQSVDAHRSGCHTWHSCPSDTGSYECGDKGYCSECPDNVYCSGGSSKPRSEQTPASSTNDSSIKSEEIKSSPQPSYSSPAVYQYPTPEAVSPTTTSVCRGSALCYTGTVKSIIDGDTLRIDKHVVRLSVVDAPERGRSGFKEATQFTKNTCSRGSTATVDQDDLQPKDKYGRIVGTVYCDGKNLNEELLTNGHATVLKYYCKKSEFGKDSWALLFGC